MHMHLIITQLKNIFLNQKNTSRIERRNRKFVHVPAFKFQTPAQTPPTFQIQALLDR